jgi:hypothetical protein
VTGVEREVPGLAIFCSERNDSVSHTTLRCSDKIGMFTVEVHLQHRGATSLSANPTTGVHELTQHDH